MRNKLILVMVFALVFAFSCAAYAEVQNVKVGGDITAVALSRDNLNFQGGIGGLNANNEFASVARIRIDADLTDSVGVTFRLLNERVWGGATGTGANVSATEVDVDLAYVTLKEFMKPTINVPVNLVLGRQNIKIGSGLLVGAAGTNQSNTNQLPVGAGDLSASSAFDAIVSVMEFTPEFTVIAGFVKASEGAVTAGQDNDVYVVDASFNLGEDAMGTVLEGTYVGSRLRAANVNNYGVRATLVPVENLNVEGEYVYQTNQTDDDTSAKEYRADAIRLGATLGLPDVVWAPSVGLDYMRLSKHWNVMHESLSPADLANLIFDNTNMIVYGATVSAKPMDDLTLKARYALLQLAKKDFGIAVNDAINAVDSYGTATGKRALGYEIDLGLAYDYTSDVQFGLNYGMLKPGKALDANNRKTASQVMGSMKVSF